MNIVFLIGNGFDLKQGLKTSYKDFYKWLKAQTDDDPKEKAWIRFKNEIDPNHKLWADLEVALGQYLANVSAENDAIEIIKRLRQKLQEYISLQDQEFAIDDKGSISLSDVVNPTSFFPEGSRRRILLNMPDFKLTDIDAKIILFNYTTTFERLFNWKGVSLQEKIATSMGYLVHEISSIEHIHGFCDDRGRLAVGIDNKDQIANPVLAESKQIKRHYVKHEFNSCYELGHPQICAGWIDKSNVICIYGMSLGKSDQRWWKVIANHLLSYKKTLLFYFVHRDMELRGNNGPEYQEQVDEDRNYLMERLGITGYDDIEQRIFVSYSPHIFTPVTPF